MGEVGGFSYLGPSLALAAPIENKLGVPVGIFWVSALVCISLAILRSYHTLTAHFATRLPLIVAGLHVIGAYSFTYVCLHLAHLLESAAMGSAVIMMLRWFFLLCATFLIIAPAILLVPLGSADINEIASPARTRVGFFLFSLVTVAQAAAVYCVGLALAAAFQLHGFEVFGLTASLAIVLSFFLLAWQFAVAGSEYSLSDRPMISTLRDGLSFLGRPAYPAVYLVFLFLSAGCAAAIFVFFLITDVANSRKSEFSGACLAPLIVLFVASVVQTAIIAATCFLIARDDSVAETTRQRTMVDSEMAAQMSEFHRSSLVHNLEWDDHELKKKSTDHDDINDNDSGGPISIPQLTGGSSSIAVTSGPRKLPDELDVPSRSPRSRAPVQVVATAEPVPRVLFASHAASSESAGNGPAPTTASTSTTTATAMTVDSSAASTASVAAMAVPLRRSTPRAIPPPPVPPPSSPTPHPTLTATAIPASASASAFASASAADSAHATGESSRSDGPPAPHPVVLPSSRTASASALGHLPASQSRTQVLHHQHHEDLSPRAPASLGQPVDLRRRSDVIPSNAAATKDHDQHAHDHDEEELAVLDPQPLMLQPLCAGGARPGSANPMPTPQPTILSRDRSAAMLVLPNGHAPIAETTFSRNTSTQSAVSPPGARAHNAAHSSVPLVAIPPPPPGPPPPPPPPPPMQAGHALSVTEESGGSPHDGDVGRSSPREPLSKQKSVEVAHALRQAMLERTQSSSNTASPVSTVPPLTASAMASTSPARPTARSASMQSAGSDQSTPKSTLSSTKNFAAFGKAVGKFLSHLRRTEEDDDFVDDFDPNEQSFASSAPTGFGRQSTSGTGEFKVVLQALNTALSQADTAAAVAAQRPAWIANLEETFKALFSPVKSVTIEVSPINGGYDVGVQYRPSGRYVALEEIEGFVHERVWGLLHPDRIATVAVVSEELV